MEKAHSKPRIRSLYETKIRSDLMKVLGVDNQHAVPRLEKIVVNMGLGKKNAREKYTRVRGGRFG